VAWPVRCDGHIKSCEVTQIVSDRGGGIVFVRITQPGTADRIGGSQGRKRVHGFGTWESNFSIRVMDF
jgi:hypothetical protein